MSTAHKDGNKYKTGDGCGCFATEEYEGKVKKWMIEEYVDSGIGKSLTEYIDDKLYSLSKSSIPRNYKLEQKKSNRKTIQPRDIDNGKYDSIFDAMKHPGWWVSIIIQLAILYAIVKLVLHIIN